MTARQPIRTLRLVPSSLHRHHRLNRIAGHPTMRPAALHPEGPVVVGGPLRTGLRENGPS